MKLKKMTALNLRKVTRARSVEHRCLFQAVGMTKRPQIGHVGNTGQEMANDEVRQHLLDGQGQVGGLQVPLLGHGDEIEDQNWVCREELGTPTPASLGGMSHLLLPLS